MGQVSHSAALVFEMAAILISNQESNSRAFIWTYIEPDAAIISACLPSLANTLGHKIFNAFKVIPAVVIRAFEHFRRRGKGMHGKDVGHTAQCTQRAAYEAFDLDEHNDIPIPAALKHNDKTETYQ